MIKGLERQSAGEVWWRTCDGEVYGREPQSRTVIENCGRELWSSTIRICLDNLEMILRQPCNLDNRFDVEEADREIEERSR